MAQQYVRKKEDGQNPFAPEKTIPRLLPLYYQMDRSIVSHTVGRRDGSLLLLVVNIAAAAAALSAFTDILHVVIVVIVIIIILSTRGSTTRTTAKGSQRKSSLAGSKIPNEQQACPVTLLGGTQK